jgi:hypothetical protein
VVIRSESERRRAEEQVEYLQSELAKIPASEQEDEVTASVINGLRMQISDIEDNLAQYDRLKKGSEPVLTADSFDDIGELVIKARIARGWSQADLARALDMEPQQVQRYERYDWEKISLWRLQEVVEALRLRCYIHAYLMEGPGALWPGAIHHAPTWVTEAAEPWRNLARYALTYSAPTPTAREGDEGDSPGQRKVKSSSMQSSGEVLAELSA